ncbi:MAG: hypothetical protein HY761_09910 [Candidatus Omnitrophica bacterium]|nr:hypothetical protein [Candidatus Omnitrophota bacterium]
MKHKKEIVTKKESVLMAAAPGRGFEEPTEKEDLLIPRAKLLQALSPEVVESPKDFQPGLIINSLTKEVLPEEIVPIFKFTNWIRFNPRKKDDPNFDPAFDPGAIIWRSSDPLDSKVIKESEFGPNGERPIATKFMNFFCLFPGHPIPVILSFSSTSFKAGKKLITLAKFAGGDMFSRKYKLIAKHVKNDMGAYYVLDVDPAGMTDESYYKAAESLYSQFKEKAKDIQVHEEIQETEE